MSDLFQGQTMTQAFRCISAGTAETFTFDFPPDKVVFYNLTDWTATAGGLPVSIWFRDLTGAGDAYQEQVIDSSAGASFNFVLEATNGFTDASTAGGTTAYRALIAGVTQANPCVVTTTANHGYATNDIIIITDLGSDMPVARGMDQLNNNRYRITVLAPTTFSLQDPITGEDIDSTGFTAWVAGGRVDLATRTLANSSPFAYDPATYALTAGTAVMGTDNDILFIEAIKYGSYENLGDLA